MGQRTKGTIDYSRASGAEYGGDWPGPTAALEAALARCRNGELDLSGRQRRRQSVGKKGGGTAGWEVLEAREVLLARYGLTNNACHVIIHIVYPGSLS